jgi:hypothetical protein
MKMGVLLEIIFLPFVVLADVVAAASVTEIYTIDMNCRKVQFIEVKNLLFRSKILSPILNCI